MAIRFFYSSQQSLSSAKLSLYCHKRTKIVLMKNELQLDFCMGIPLNHLIDSSLIYVKARCLNFKRKKYIDSVDYYDLLDAFFYLIATGYQLNRYEKWFVVFFEYYKKKIFLSTNACENRAKLYLYLILNNDFIGDIFIRHIYDNKRILDVYYEEFVAIIEKNNLKLYDILSIILKSCNRMKSFYNRTEENCLSVGYQDFSAIFSVLGMLTLWKNMGINLNNETVNKIFKREFGKDMSFFNF